MFSQALPLGSPGLPTTNLRAWAAVRAGLLTCVPDMPLAVFQPSPARRRGAGAEGQPPLLRWAWHACSLPTNSLCWASADTFPSVCCRAPCTSDRSPSCVLPSATWQSTEHRNTSARAAWGLLTPSAEHFVPPPETGWHIKSVVLFCRVGPASSPWRLNLTPRSPSLPGNCFAPEEPWG